LKERLVVAVGPGAHSEQVVRAGRRLAGSLRADWIAVYVETPALQRLPETERARVLRTLRLAQELGAETATVPGQDVARALIGFAGERNASKIVLGRTNAPAWRRLIGRSTYDALFAHAGAVDLLVVGGEATEQAAPAVSIDEPERRDAVRSGRLWGGSGRGHRHQRDRAVSSRPHRRHQHRHAVSDRRGVGVGAHGPRTGHRGIGGRRGCFDFICVPPYFTFAVSDTEYLLTFAVMLMVALTITELTAGMRYQARIAAHRGASRRSTGGDESRAARVRSPRADRRDRRAGTFAACSKHRRLCCCPTARNGCTLRPRDAKPACRTSTSPWPSGCTTRWEPAGARHRHAGGNADSLRAIARAGAQSRRACARAAQRTPDLRAGTRRLLDTFAAQIALALERVHFVEVAQEAEIACHRKRLRNSLLASIPTTLRTPLAVIAGAAGSLGEQELTAEARRNSSQRS
jgi:two-component system sensor histidine kinase KdpD